MNSDHSRSEDRPLSGDSTIVDRLEQIEDSLVRESWLPISFRGLLATELPALAKAAGHSGSGWRKAIAKQVMTLALASWIYAPSPLESETVARLQALDLELNTSESYQPDDVDSFSGSFTDETF